MSLISIATSTSGCHLLTPTPQMAMMMKVPGKRILSSYHKPPIRTARRFYHYDPRQPRYNPRRTEQRSNRPAAFIPSSEIRHSQPAFSRLRSAIEADETRQPSEHTNHQESRILDEVYRQLASAEQQRAKTIEELRMLNQMIYHLANSKAGVERPNILDSKTNHRISDADENRRQEDHNPEDELSRVAAAFGTIFAGLFLIAVLPLMVVGAYVALREFWSDLIAWISDLIVSNKNDERKNENSSSSLNPRFH